MISDTHFLHTNIIKYTNRPANFNELIFKNWNNLVSDDNLIIHCGDFSAGVGRIKDGFKKLEKITLNLKGHKILIKGNHDYFPKQTYEDWGFEVCDYFIFDKFIFCHYPLIIAEYMDTLTKNFIKKIKQIKEKNNIPFVIHGHKHSKNYPNYPNHYNVCVERIGYKPILLSEIKKKLEGKDK